MGASSTLSFPVPGSTGRHHWDSRRKLDLVVGAVTVAGTSIALPVSAVRAYVKGEFTLTLATAATLRVTGSTSIRAQVTDTTWYRGVAPTEDIAFDGTVENALDAIYTFDTPIAPLSSKLPLTTFKEEVAE